MYTNLLLAYWQEAIGHYNIDREIERSFDENKVGITEDWSDFVLEDPEYGHGVVRCFDASGQLLVVCTIKGDDQDFKFTSHGKAFMRPRLMAIIERMLDSME